MNSTKIYFPNLNGVRFIAALLIIIHHVEQIKTIFNLDSCYKTIPFIEIIGKLGVILFFVLSGFLITYLLLAEENKTKTINIKDFYIRRILRIWPLYFLILVLALLVLPQIDLFALPGYGKEVIYKNLYPKIILYTLFFPNLVLVLYGAIPYVSHTWSIGTEEQFYLIWPIILKYFKKKRIFLMILIVLFYKATDIILYLNYFNHFPYIKIMQGYWFCFNIDCMAIGGFFAIVLFQKNNLLKFLLNNYLFYSVLVLLISFLAMGIYVPHIHNQFYSLLFGIVILNFAANKKLSTLLENKPLVYLGKISYGIYMYHLIGIVLSIYLMKSINVSSNLAIYSLSIGFTLLFASVSYEYFESIFLILKKRFSSISSGTD